MQLEKPKLFLETKHFLSAMLLLSLVVALRLVWSYHTYSNFITKPFFYLNATVLNAYTKSKNGKSYTVLKLNSDNGLTFFTSTSRRQSFLNKRLRLMIYPSERISFADYLGYFYVKSRIKRIEDGDVSIKNILMHTVAKQHDDVGLQSFYNAIFFATPLQKRLREKVSGLGISHLVALSGFHLGILWGLVYGVLILLYRPFQKRYFPYRYTLLDMGLVAIVMLGVYVWFVGAPPSLVRSYAMVLVGWVMVLLGIELLSFTFLVTIMLTLLTLFSSLIASLSFWLSIAGVFYIYLLLSWTQETNKWTVSLLYIPIGIFLFMLPIVHGIFGVTTPYQLLSPLLSLLFVLFYPLVMVLHLVGQGSLLDSALLWLFELSGEGVEKLLPLWVVAGYIGLSLAAIWSRVLFVVVLGLAVGYAGYLFLWFA